MSTYKTKNSTLIKYPVQIHLNIQFQYFTAHMSNKQRGRVNTFRKPHPLY